MHLKKTFTSFFPESWNSTVPWNAPIWQLSTRAVLDAFNKSRQKLRAAKQGV